MAKHRTIAVVIDLEWTYQHHHGIYQGIQEFARQNKHWNCFLSPWLDGTDLSEKRLAGRPIDGIVARATSQMAADAKRRKIPIVNVQMGAPVPNVSVVQPDRFAVGQIAAEHLVARGFRRFAYLGFRACMCTKTQLQGFRQTLANYDLKSSAMITGHNFSSDPDKWKQFVDSMGRVIRSWDAPVGVNVTIDLLGRYFIEVCQRHGLRVPEDVAVVGTQNEQVLCLQGDPTMTSIDLGYPRVGYRAAALLDQMMDGLAPPSEPILVEPKELIARQSTDALAVDDPLVAKALEFISQHSHEPIDVEDIAKGVATTRRTLERRFESTLQRGVGQEITRMRIERVKRQLVETNTPLKILVGESGFTDEKQMSRTFARLTGVTPGVYRNKRRK